MSKETEVPEEPIRFTIVIPTLNAAQRVSWTLDSLNRQDYSNLEVILVDAGSTDRTIDLVQRGYRGKVRIYSVNTYSPFEMYNRGISLATGDYVSILFPGDSYLAKGVLSHVVETITEQKDPDLVYSGSLIRDESPEPRVHFWPLTLEDLQEGRSPATLQSCWFRVGTIRRLGKFDPQYRIRGGYDFLCRFCLYGGLNVGTTTRVLVDHETQVSRPGVWARRFWETQHIIRRYFGKRAWISWLVGAHSLRFLKFWWKSPQVFGD